MIWIYFLIQKKIEKKTIKITDLSYYSVSKMYEQNPMINFKLSWLYFKTMCEIIIFDLKNNYKRCQSCFLFFLIPLLMILVYVLLCVGGLGVSHYFYSGTYNMTSGCLLNVTTCDCRSATCIRCRFAYVEFFLFCDLISLAIIGAIICLGIAGVVAVMLLVALCALCFPAVCGWFMAICQHSINWCCELHLRTTDRLDLSDTD